MDTSYGGSLEAMETTSGLLGGRDAMCACFHATTHHAMFFKFIFFFQVGVDSRNVVALASCVLCVFALCALSGHVS
jgi:hypothetical protein